MNFDLRIPVGLMFTVFGLILVGVGCFGGPALPEISLGINMNLWWGLVQLLFGLVMLGFGLMAKPGQPRRKSPRSRSIMFV